MSTRTDARLDRNLNPIPQPDLADVQTEMIGALESKLEDTQAALDAAKWSLHVAKLPQGPQTPAEALRYLAGAIRAFLPTIKAGGSRRPIIGMTCVALEHAASLAESAAEFLAKEMPV